jgi:hypothetical protein
MFQSTIDCDVRLAADSRRAQMIGRPPDLVLLDVRMRMDGRGGRRIKACLAASCCCSDDHRLEPDAAPCRRARGRR